MVDEMKTASALVRRIEAGQAEPISDREREQLNELLATYSRRFGEAEGRRLAESLHSA